MTLEEARRILGLAADEDPQVHMAGFAAARERIAELVRTAPNETIALRYQDGLIDFDRALAALREEMEKEDPEIAKREEWMRAARGSRGDASQVTGAAAAPETAPPEEALAEQEFEHHELPDKPPDRRLVGTIFVILMLAVAGGGIAYTKFKEHERFRIQERLTFLERLGGKMVEARRWDEAGLAYREIEELAPGSVAALIGRRSIEAGMEEKSGEFRDEGGRVYLPISTAAGD